MQNTSTKGIKHSGRFQTTSDQFIFGFYFTMRQAVTKLLIVEFPSVLNKSEEDFRILTILLFNYPKKTFEQRIKI